MADDKIKKYYDYLKAEGEDLPDEESFRRTLTNPEKADKYYDYLKGKNYEVPESKEVFYNTFNVKKKDAGALPSGGQSPYPEGEQPSGFRTVYEREPGRKPSEEVEVIEPEVFTIDPEATAQKQKEDKAKREEEYSKFAETIKPFVSQSREFVDSELDKIATNQNYFTGAEIDPELGDYPPVPSAFLRTKQVDRYKSARRLLDDIEKFAETPTDEGLQSFWKGLSSKGSLDLLTLGYSEMFDEMSVANAAQRSRDGIPLSPDEEVLLTTKYIMDQLQAKKDMPSSFNIGAGVAEMVPYIAQIALTKGIGSGVSGGAKQLARGQLRKIITKYGLADLAGAAASAPFTGIMWESVAEKRTGELGLDEEGNIIAIKGTEETPREAIAKAWTNTSIELFTERFVGNQLSNLKLFGKSAAKTMKDPVKAGKFQTAVNKFKKQANWDGLMSEWGEEQVSAIGQAITTGDASIQDLLDVKNQFEMFSTIAITQGAFKAGEIPGYVKKKMQDNKYESAKKSLDMIEDQELKNQIINDIEGSKNANELRENLRDRGYEQLDPAQQKAILDFMEAKIEKDVIDGMEMTPMEEEMEAEKEVPVEKMKPKEPVLVKEEEVPVEGEAIISEKEPLSLRTEKQIKDYGSKLDEKIKGRNSELSLGGTELRRRNITETPPRESRYDVRGSRRVAADASVNQYSLSDQEVKSLTSADPNVKVDQSFSEVDDSNLFHKSITASKEGNPYAASVFVYPVEEYETSKKFLTDDGLAGAAIDKDGTIISVFSHGKGKGRAPQVVMQAIKEGGRKLDHYNTALTQYYYNFGFVPVAKVKWNDEYAPDDWNKETFKRFNNGEPDVVLMAYQGGDPNTLHERYRAFGNAKEALDAAPYVETFEQGQKLQDQFIKQATNLKTEGYEKSMQKRQDVYEKRRKEDEGRLRKGTEKVREGKEDEVLKAERRAEEMGEVREEGKKEEPFLRQKGKPIRSVYSVDRDDAIRQAIQRTGNIQEKKPVDLIADAQSMEELDFLLSNNKVKLSPEFNKRKDALRKENKLEDEAGRIKDLNTQLTALKSPQVEAKLKKDLGARYNELKEKRGDVMSDISERIARIGGAKFAVGEDGAKPDIVSEIVGLLKDFAELGMIDLELGVRKALDKLKSYVDDDVKKAIDDNADAVEKAFEKEPPAKKEVPPEEPPVEEGPVEREVPEGKKRRRAAERLLQDPNISKDIKEGLSEDAINYIPISNTVTEHEAKAIINEKYAATGNYDQSVKDVTSEGNKLTPRVRVTMAGELIGALNREMELAEGTERTKLQNDAINVAEFVTKFGTTLGQGVQAFNIWGRLNTETVIQKFNNDLEKLRGKKLTPTEEKKLRGLSKKVSQAKKGFQRAKAIHDMLAYQMRLEGIKWGDVAMSVWYAHVLSGYTTQQLNAMANLAETMGEVLTSMVYSPKRAPWLLKGLFDGYGRGLLEAWATLKTGYAPVKSVKMDFDKDKPGVLEAYQGFKMFGRRWNPFRFHKYVPRVMSAVDTFFYHGLKGMRAYELAHMEVEGKGKSWRETENLINEKLGRTAERKQEARNQLEEESKEFVRYLELELGQLNKDLKTAKTASEKKTIQDEISRVEKEMKGIQKKGKFYQRGSTDYKRRFFEIMEETMPDEMVIDMDDFASRGTFNYATEGRLGKVTDTVAALTNTKGMKAAKFVVPFTRIISNVANRYLDWSPYGFYRAMKGGIGYKPRTEKGTKYSREFTREQMMKEYIKASLGTLAAATLYMMAKGNDDEDDSQGPFEITAAGTGDYRKNYNLKETGWQQYSIRVGDKWYSYQNTPLAIPLQAIGTLKDLSKYKGVDLEDAEWDKKAQIVVWNTFKYFTDFTFLRGLSEFMTNFSQDDVGKVEGYFKRFAGQAAKGFAVPNLVTQVSRKIQSVNEMPIKEADNILQQIYRDIPIARKGLRDMVNGLGETIIPDTDRYVSEVEPDPVWDLITENNAWIKKPSKNIRTYDLDTGKERMVTPEEYYDYAKIRGEKIKRQIQGNMEALQEMKPSEVRDAIDEYESRAGKEAKADLALGRISYGLNEIKAQDPDAFKVLKDYKGFFDAPSSVSIYVAGEERYMKEAELDQYRKLALENYVKEIRRTTGDLDKEKMDRMKDRVITTPAGTITDLEIKMDIAWAKAETKAYSEMLKKIKKAEREK